MVPLTTGRNRGAVERHLNNLIHFWLLGFVLTRKARAEPSCNWRTALALILVSSKCYIDATSSFSK